MDDIDGTQFYGREGNALSLQKDIYERIDFKG